MSDHKIDKARQFCQQCLQVWPCRDGLRHNVGVLTRLTLARCQYHHLPLVDNPQGDTHLPLLGWYHPVQCHPDAINPTGIAYGRCELTDEERVMMTELCPWLPKGPAVCGVCGGSGEIDDLPWLYLPKPCDACHGEKREAAC